MAKKATAKRTAKRKTKEAPPHPTTEFEAALARAFEGLEIEQGEATWLETCMLEGVDSKRPKSIDSDRLALIVNRMNALDYKPLQLLHRQRARRLHAKLIDQLATENAADYGSPA